jgi:hypothetical protein
MDPSQRQETHKRKEGLMTLHLLVTIESSDRTRFLKETAHFEQELQAYAERLYSFQTQGPAPRVTVKKAPECFEPAHE